MKTIQNKSLGFIIPLLVPSTLEECKTIFGNEESIVDIVVAQETYHGWNNIFRDKLCDAVEKQFKVARRVLKEIPPTKEGGKPTKQYEPAVAFIKHVLSQGVTKEQLTPLALEIGKSIKFGEGGSSVGGRIGKTFLDTATAILALNPAEIDQVVANLVQFNEGLVIDKDDSGKPTVDSLARALKVDQLNQEAARKARLGIGSLPKPVVEDEEEEEGDDEAAA
jgi:hypothetical protein